MTMTSPPIRNMLTWAPVTFAIIAGAITWGVTTQRVQALEDKAETASNDHDRIVRIETQITTVTTSVGDVREEQKEIRADVRRLEGTINDNFRMLLEEVRKQRP